jgi:lysophospholipase L1-like esterase
MPDGLHPATPGYQIWADAMQPLLEEMLKDKQ